MVTVDDLRISVTIDDAGNLGKLQKQLTALVGPRGEKKLDLGGIDPVLKRDIEIIKDRIVKFTPTVLVGENIKEAALNLASDLRQNQNLTDIMLQRYNINIDKYESFVEELLNISMGISKMNNDQAKGYIAEMTKFRAISDMIKGDRETLIKKLTRMKLEAGFHEKIVDAFREAGIKLLSKPLMFELTKESIGKSFEDVIKEYELGEEKGKFAALKEIFDKNSDSLKGISEAYEYMKGEVFDITEITQDMIEKDEDLRLIIVAQVAAGIEKSNWMFEQFYKAGKSFFTKGKAFGVAGAAQLDTVVHRFSKEAIEQLGIEKVVGDSIDEATENLLVEFKTVAGKSEVDYELTKRIVKQGYGEIHFIVEEYTDEAVNYIEEFLAKEENKDKKIGLHKLLPRTVEKLLGIETKLDDVIETAKASLEKQEEQLEWEEEKTDEKLDKIQDDLDDLLTRGGPETKLTKRVEDHETEQDKEFEELMELMGEVKDTVDDTNKEVKKENIAGKDIVEKLDED